MTIGSPAWLCCVPWMLIRWIVGCLIVSYASVGSGWCEAEWRQCSCGLLIMIDRPSREEDRETVHMAWNCSKPYGLSLTDSGSWLMCLILVLWNPLFPSGNRESESGRTNKWEHMIPERDKLTGHKDTSRNIPRPYGHEGVIILSVSYLLFLHFFPSDSQTVILLGLDMFTCPTCDPNNCKTVWLQTSPPKPLSCRPQPPLSGWKYTENFQNKIRFCL